MTITNHLARDSDTWQYGSFNVCLSGSGPAVLEKVEAVRVGSIEVQRAAVRQLTPGADRVGGWPGKLSSDFHDVKDFRITQPCDEEKEPVELALQVGRPSAGSGPITGFRLLYHAGGKSYSAPYAVTIVLCGGQDRVVDDAVFADCRPS